VSYARRRRLATLAGAASAAGLTALSAWALGGHAPNPDTASSAAVAPDRTVRRTVKLTRTVPGPVTEPTTRASASPASAPRAAARPTAAPRPASGRSPARRDAGARRPARRAPSAAPAPAPGQAADGYRAFASATAALAGDLVLARSGSAAALDGHPLDTADELGTLVAGLPAGRTAFGRAIAMRGDAATTASSPPAGPAATQDAGRGWSATTTARTDAQGSCVHGAPISSAEARAAAASAGHFALTAGRSRTESLLDAAGERNALVSRAVVVPPEVSIAPGTPAAVTVRFLGPVELLTRAGGTPGSAAVELGPQGADTAAPLVEVRAPGRSIRYTAADVLQGGGRTIRLGAVTIVLGGAPRAWRGDPGSRPLVGADGTFAAAAADLLTLRLGDGTGVALGHLEASVAVPARGVRC
jgi:hypothetical protein